MRLFKRCPSVDKLEAFARSETTSERLTRHVERCAQCHEITSQIRTDAELVVALRAAAGAGDLTDADRSRIQDVCRGAVDSRV